MGIVDSVKQKVASHHEQQRRSVDGLDTRNDDRNSQDLTTSEWVRKGQGSDRSDDHGHRAGSLTDADTASGMSNPKVAEKLLNDKDRVGSTSQ